MPPTERTRVRPRADGIVAVALLPSAPPAPVTVPRFAQAGGPANGNRGRKLGR